MKRFEVKFDCPQEFDGEYGYFFITAVRTGRKWREVKRTPTEFAGEIHEVLEGMINDGEKLNPDEWTEVTKWA